MTTVLAGEPPAESFDRLPPRQLAPSRESWRFSFSGGHTLPNTPRAVYARDARQSIDSYTAGGLMAGTDNQRIPGKSERVD
jgi:hypothetical protein